jgi:hypothetical protein
VLKCRGVDSHPPGGFVNFSKKNASSPAQSVSKESLSQPINICDDSDYGGRTEKRLSWTKEEDLVLVSYFLLANGLYIYVCFTYITLFLILIDNYVGWCMAEQFKRSNPVKLQEEEPILERSCCCIQQCSTKKQGKASQVSQGSLWEN